MGSTAWVVSSGSSARSMHSHCPSHSLPSGTLPTASLWCSSAQLSSGLCKQTTSYLRLPRLSFHSCIIPHGPALQCVGFSRPGPSTNTTRFVCPSLPCLACCHAALFPLLLRHYTQRLALIFINCPSFLSHLSLLAPTLCSIHCHMQKRSPQTFLP